MDNTAAIPKARGWSWSSLISGWPVWLGLAIVSFSTWRFITTENWSTEQGAHGPLVLASGLWLLVRLLPETEGLRQRPPPLLAFGAVGVMAFFMLAFRAAAVIELEVYALYGLFLALLYAFIGARALAVLWFPLLYLVFAVPVPESLVAALTNPLKLWISETAARLLYEVGYPIANSGVTIQIGPYQLLVAAACAGLNSLITLTALTIFYAYLNHRAEWQYMLTLAVAAIPIAIFSNLVRVLILILITFHVGEAAAQGFLHNFAGMTTFAIALVTMFVVDQVLMTAWKSAKRRQKSDQPSPSLS